MLNKLRVIVLGLFVASSMHAAPMFETRLIGTWAGHPDGMDQHPVLLKIYRLNGDCSYSEPSSNVFVTGLCSWGQTTSTGGIITLHYVTYSPKNTFHNKLYIGVTFIDDRTIRVQMGSGPHEKGTMKRL